MRHLLMTALLALTLSGCGAGWHREEATPATVIPPRKQVLVYHGGGVERWHATSVTADSIVGVPWLKPIECDSCRTTLPLILVDSIQVGDPSAGFRKSAALGYGLGLLFLLFTCGVTTVCTTT